MPRNSTCAVHDDWVAGAYSTSSTGLTETGAISSEACDSLAACALLSGTLNKMMQLDCAAAKSSCFASEIVTNGIVAPVGLMSYRGCSSRGGECATAEVAPVGFKSDVTCGCLTLSPRGLTVIMIADLALDSAIRLLPELGNWTVIVGWSS